jgi:hypothetical protein
MSFSASTCLSYLGSTTLGPTLKIYSNPPLSNINNGVYVDDVATSAITGGNCPYSLILPDGTTTVRLFDPISFCYCDIPISDNNVCTTCNLDFDSISNNQISTIYVGNLTGSCDSSISDYRIGWYGPDNSSTLAFTSGKGTIFPHQVNHPITSSSLDAPLLLPGNYISKITDVELNGVRFSYTGGTNNVPSPELINCSTGATVTAFNCSNGTNPGVYSHYKQFVTDGSSTPQSLSATFILSANTPSFIWALTSFSVYDTLTLTFSGSNYPVPINLEYLKLGGDAGGTNLLPGTFPKVFQSASEFRKVTTLTGLTVNNGDSIIINITPNPTTNATSWTLKFSCYGTPTATKTCLDSYKDKPYQIKLDTITATTDSCGEVTISYSVSGCSQNDNSAFVNSDLVTLSSNLSPYQISTNNTTKLLNIQSSKLYSGRTSLDTYGFNSGVACTNSGAGNTISVTKTTSGFNFFFSNINDVSAYYNAFIAKTNQVKTYGTGFVNDNTNINYYRYIYLVYPTNTGNFTCGDGLVYNYHYLHCNAVCSTGTTTGGYTMFVESLPMTNNYTCPTICTTNCPNNIASYVSLVNTTNTTTFSTITNTSGLRYDNPFYYGISTYLSTIAESKSSAAQGTLQFTPMYSTNTYTSSGSTNPLIPDTLIPTLSGTTWDWGNHFYTNPLTSYQQDVFYYQSVIQTFSPLTYKIFAYPVSNFAFNTSTLIEIYDSTNPSGYNPTYIY